MIRIAGSGFLCNPSHPIRITLYSVIPAQAGIQ